MFSQERHPVRPRARLLLLGHCLGGLGIGICDVDADNTGRHAFHELGTSETVQVVALPVDVFGDLLDRIGHGPL